MILKKMLFVLKNRNLLKIWGQKAKKRVELNFDENLLTKKLLEFFHSKIN